MTKKETGKEEMEDAMKAEDDVVAGAGEGDKRPACFQTADQQQ